MSSKGLPDVAILLVGLMAALSGLSLVVIPLSSTLQKNVIYLLLEQRLLIFFFGLVLLSMGCALLLSFSKKWQRSTYHFSSSKDAVDVDLALLKTLVKNLLSKRFPNELVSFEMTFAGAKNQEISLSVDLPYIPIEEQKSFAKHLSHEVEDTLRHSLSSLPPLKQSFSFAHVSLLSNTP